MSEKKKHEVEVMAREVAKQAAEHGVTCIVDVGSGYCCLPPTHT